MSCGTLEDSNRLPLRLMISKLIGSDIKAKGLPIRIATNARIAGPRVLIRAIEPMRLPQGLLGASAWLGMSLVLTSPG
jgi:hypothetical protein